MSYKHVESFKPLAPAWSRMSAAGHQCSWSSLLCFSFFQVTMWSVGATTVDWPGSTWICLQSRIKCSGETVPPHDFMIGVSVKREHFADVTILSLNRHHKKALRSVAYHKHYPLCASGSDDGSVVVCHGMVYKWVSFPFIFFIQILSNFICHIHNYTQFDMWKCFIFLSLIEK